MTRTLLAVFLASLSTLVACSEPTPSDLGGSHSALDTRNDGKDKENDKTPASKKPAVASNTTGPTAATVVPAPAKSDAYGDDDDDDDDDCAACSASGDDDDDDDDSSSSSCGDDDDDDDDDSSSSSCGDDDDDDDDDSSSSCSY